MPNNDTVPSPSSNTPAPEQPTRRRTAGHLFTYAGGLSELSQWATADYNDALSDFARHVAAADPTPTQDSLPAADPASEPEAPAQELVLAEMIGHAPLHVNVEQFVDPAFVLPGANAYTLPTAPPKRPQTRVHICYNCGDETRCQHIQMPLSSGTATAWYCLSCIGRAKPCTDCGRLTHNRALNAYTPRLAHRSRPLRQICHGCARNYCLCGQCGSVHPKIAAVMLSDGRAFCRWCAQQVQQCGLCNTRVRHVVSTSLIVRRDGEPVTQAVCPTCARNVDACRQCECSVLRAELRPHPRRPLTRKVCPDCEQQLQPHFTPPQVPVKTYKRTLGIRNSYGLELECFAPAGLAIASNIFQFGTDGSIVPTPGCSGIEYRSRILQGDQGLALLHSFLRKANRSKHAVNTSCGLHIHVDASGYTNEQLLNLVSFIERYDTVLFGMQHPSRWDNRYCRGFAAPAGSLRTEGIEFFEQCNRYRGANFKSFFEHGTVEFRYAAGSLDFRSILLWLRVCLSVVAIGTQRSNWHTGRRLNAAPETLDELLSVLQLPAFDRAHWREVYARQSLTEHSPLYRVQE